MARWLSASSPHPKPGALAVPVGEKLLACFQRHGRGTWARPSRPLGGGGVQAKCPRLCRFLIRTMGVGTWPSQGQEDSDTGPMRVSPSTGAGLGTFEIRLTRHPRTTVPDQHGHGGTSQRADQ